ncbi:MAG: hypothetical protein ACRD51_05220 [Candidatus Acidiferrum sp.]
MELVHELPAAAIVRHGAVAPGDPEEDPFCSFWTGDDPRIQAELCELLEKAKIPYKTLRREDHLFNISNYAAFQIGIPFSMFEKAEALVKEAYGSEEAIEPASRLLPVDSEHIPGTRFGPDAFGPWAATEERNWQGFTRLSIMGSAADSDGSDSGRPEGAERSLGQGDAGEANTEIWSGNEPELAEFIGASLQVNQIAFRQAIGSGKHVLYVFAEDEARAKEIVREVVEGVPPE